MTFSEPVVELSLTVTVTTDAEAAEVGETLARNAVGLSRPGVMVQLCVDRYDRVCHHDEAVEP